MTLRLTSNRRAGTLRKLVAVGTERLFSIFVTIAAPTPRSGSRVEPSGTAVTGATAEAAGAGADAGDGDGVVAATDG